MVVLSRGLERGDTMGGLSVRFKDAATSHAFVEQKSQILLNSTLVLLVLSNLLLILSSNANQYRVVYVSISIH